MGGLQIVAWSEMKTSALCLILLSLTACTANAAFETPQDRTTDQAGEWAMEGHNPQRTRATTTQTHPPLTVEQEFVVGGSTQYGSPVNVANGLVFVEGEKKLYALSRTQGEEAWSFDLPGFFVSPAIERDSVFVRAEAGEDGYIFALTAADGLKLWQFKFPRVGSSQGNLGGHATSPVVVDGSILVGAARSFLALDAETGQQIWAFKTDEPITSSASVADGTVFFVDFNNLYAVDLKTGDEQWRFEQDGLSVIFAPVIIGDQVVTAFEDNVIALNRYTGAIEWQMVFADERLIPAGADENHIYVKSANLLYALDRESGEQRWSYYATDFVSLPAITTDLAYIVTRSGGSAQLRAIDLTNGEEVWQGNNASLSNAAPIVVGKRVYVRTTDGRVLIYS